MSAAEASKSPWGETRRRRGKQFPVKREAVLAAAASLLRRNGYNGMSLSELAEILNITKPTLYYYVGSKDELFSEIVERAQNEILEFMKSVVAEELSGYEKLKAIMFKYVELVNSDFGACTMLTLPPDMDPAILRQHIARTRQGNALIYQVLEQGAKDGTLRIVDSTVVLHALFGSLNWTTRWYKPTGRLSLRKIADMQVTILLEGVKGQAAGDTPAKPSPRKRAGT